MPYLDLNKRRENHTRYMREVWYPKNREKHKVLAAIRRKRNRKILSDWLNNIKSNSGCVDCHSSDWRVLDFDHVGLKTFTFSKFVSSSKELKTNKDILLREIENCEIRCSNCHRIKTWERKYGVVYGRTAGS